MLRNFFILYTCNFEYNVLNPNELESEKPQNFPPNRKPTRILRMNHVMVNDYD